jgi:hypothetical protein
MKLQAPLKNNLLTVNNLFGKILPGNIEPWENLSKGGLHMKNVITKALSLTPALVDRIKKAMVLLHTENFSYAVTLAIIEWLEKKGC